jgi:hypothetical protein
MFHSWCGRPRQHKLSGHPAELPAVTEHLCHIYGTSDYSLGAAHNNLWHPAPIERDAPSLIGRSLVQVQQREPKRGPEPLLDVGIQDLDVFAVSPAQRAGPDASSAPCRCASVRP